MSKNIIERVRRLVADGGMSRSGLARAAGLHANTLRECTDEAWNPTAETLRKLEQFLWDSDEEPVLVPIEEIIDEARNGRMFILVDDEDRENEGDLVIPAQMATPDAVNFMATHGRGLICLTLTRQRTEQLGLELMSRNNGTRHETAFTVSIEAREGVTTGISAGDRARTVAVAIDAAKGRDDIVTPGHVFPLIARDGGVLVRAGHTEASVDISRLAGLNPSGVICEIMNEDGTMARMDDLIPFARRHGLKMGTIRDLIEYRRKHDHLVERVAETPFVSDYGGDWRLITYRNKVDGTDSFVLQKGQIVPGEATLARVHTISILDDMLGQPGPKKRTLQRAMAEIGREGSGLIVLLINPTEGGGRAGTGAAPDMDLRAYGIGAQILADLGVHQMTLLTNSHRNVVAIEGYGINIVGERAIPSE
ncbi:MAG: 3,4-dihydroxy-2-butanone-4-phosphate synthase [Pseudomonadota bacterium]|jgi:3,4-dihydroxy 2-butanone 4-phosphate synthase/GTP cyclohydrolase II|nr:3,4-dihydroxy-2-butanone-4-phosphate synthase [Novosphingobium sp.]HPB21836.1 3,4-dihydroxy-2-butanone-4-phosphate synthase [Novosphingobium sp.]HPZ46917.1 3,4-dihydroxy-2-butanone-4-phosphate synthase [Novosphingobium sp.]HQD98979.1 3,4-dihydroxy-2-butanone-4-phosphate synthase [Novosphingobium sp.]HQN54327.1 3,4-dihydroxy-2-butanone-4-phosphate synthase [Novosphingobium sp.]